MYKHIRQLQYHKYIQMMHVYNLSNTIMLSTPLLTNCHLTSL